MSQSRKNGHRHQHEHSQAHTQTQGHTPAYTHTHDHTHCHTPAYTHDHTHAHTHDHTHAHSHAHSQTHSHSHGHAESHESQRRIGRAFILNLGFCLIEIFGAYAIGSLTILAGAIHDLGDSLTLGCAWYFEGIARKSPNSEYNYGYRRFSLISSVIAGLVVSIGALAVIFEAAQSLAHPSSSVTSSFVMMGLALVGIIVNSVAAWSVASGDSQNEKILSWHLIQDVLTWAAILISAVVLHFAQIQWLDGAMAIGVSVFVLFHIFGHLKESLLLLLQRRPGSFDEGQVRKILMHLPNVEDVTDIKVWSMDGAHHVLSIKLRLSQDHHLSELLDLEEKLRAELNQIGSFEVSFEYCLSPNLTSPEK